MAAPDIEETGDRRTRRGHTQSVTAPNTEEEADLTAPVADDTKPTAERGADGTNTADEPTAGDAPIPGGIRDISVKICVHETPSVTRQASLPILFEFIPNLLAQCYYDSDSDSDVDIEETVDRRICRGHTQSVAAPNIEEEGDLTAPVAEEERGGCAPSVASSVDDTIPTAERGGDELNTVDKPTAGEAPIPGGTNESNTGAALLPGGSEIISPPRIRRPSASSSTLPRSSGRKSKIRSKDIQDELSPRTLSSTQIRKKGTVFDASSFGLKWLRHIQTDDSPRFIKLDFTYCSEDIINELFPVDASKFTSVPPSYRSSSKSILEFQRLPKQHKEKVVLDEKFISEDIESGDVLVGLDPVVIKKKPCPGITLEFLRYYSGRTSSFTKSTKSFSILMSESIYCFAKWIRYQYKSWKNGSDVIGVLASKKKSGVSFDEWFCRRVVPQYSVDSLDTFGMQSGGCVRVMEDDVEMCGVCMESCGRFFRRMDAALDLRQAPISLKTNTSIIDNHESPGLWSERAKFLMGDRRKVQIAKYQAKRKLNKLSVGNYGDVLSLDADKFNSDLIFDDQLVELGKKHFQEQDSNEGVSNNSLQSYIFEECVLQSRRARKSCKKSCKYSFLMIRLAISLKLKLTKGSYDFISKCFNLPSDSQLSRYKSPSVGAPDSILFDTINAERSLFENLNGDLPVDNWKRHGSLAWDSMVIKEKLYFCPNTMRIVGYADDAFDLNVIMSEFKNRMIDLDESNNSPKNAPMAKHFLVFIFTSWEKNMKRHQMVAARYGVLFLDESYIMDKLLACTVALSKFGWIVDSVGGDGASENRSALKQLGTITARDSLMDTIVDLYGGAEILGKLPLDIKIVFPHPVHSDVLIFISADMPHLIKK